MLNYPIRCLFVTAFCCVASSQPVYAQGGFWRDLFSPRQDFVKFTASEEFIFMARDYDMRTQGPAINGPDRGLLDFSTSSGSSELESGYRVSLGLEGAGHRIEGIFAEYGDWQRRQTGSLTAGISFDGNPAAAFPAGSNFLGTNTYFSAINAAAVAEADEADGLGPTNANADTLPQYTQFYNSSLQDLQINLIDNDPCKEFRFGFGYRNATLDELAGLTVSGSFRAENPGDGSLNSINLTNAGLNFVNGTDDGFQEGTPDNLTMSWTGDTSNQLNGFQWVVDACLFDGCKRSISVVGKAGAFHNYARGSVTERYTGVGGNTSVYERTFQDSDDAVAFMGSVAVRGRRCITSHLNLIFGYEAMFMSGLALAPEQVDGVRGGTFQVQTDGSVIVHGGHVGLELTY